MSKKIIISQEDWEVFLKANSGTRPIKNKKRHILASQKISEKIIKRPHPIDDELELSEKEILDPLTAEDEIQYKQKDVANETLRKLGKGQYNTEAILDLHGMSIDEAGAALQRFLNQCMKKKVRIALIIHGKGAQNPFPILKNKLNHWLRDMPIILAFCSAPQKLGGRGAMMILLKENKV